MQKEISLRELIHPTPKQEVAFKTADQADYFLFGGAAGPGKSYWLRWYLIRTLIKWGKEYNLRGIHGALFSEDYPTLKDRQISKMEVEVPRWLGEIKDSKTDGLGLHINKRWGGHVLMLRNLDDPSKYLSSEFAIIGVEELTKNVEEKFHQLRSRMRWTGIPHPKFVAATNPGEVGHAWVKRRWIDKDFPIEEASIANRFAYVPALPTDNPHLAQSYLETLKSLPEKQRKAYLEGNWDIFEGQYFTEWDKTQHVAIPFAIPRSWPKFRAYDYGYEAPAVCKWYTLDHDGRVWVYRELSYPKGHKTNVDEQAKDILRLSEGEEYDYSVADPAIFASTGVVDNKGGQTIAESFARRGVMFMPGSNRRIDGWNIMHQYLAWSPVQKPKMMYFQTCAGSIRTIPTLVHDDIKPEDLDTMGDDHWADVDRYFLMSLHERKPRAPLNHVEEKLLQLQERDTLKAENINELYYG